MFNRLALRAVAGCIALALISGCVGSFALTRKVYEFNAGVSEEKWVRECLFIFPCSFLYAFATGADAIAINSVEFWTGENPVMVAPSSVDEPQPRPTPDSSGERNGSPMAIELRRVDEQRWHFGATVSGERREFDLTRQGSHFLATIDGRTVGCFIDSNRRDRSAHLIPVPSTHRRALP